MNLELGCWGHFLHILSHSNQTAHTVNTVHGSRAATGNCVKCAISSETDCCRNYCHLTHFWAGQLEIWIFCPEILHVLPCTGATRESRSLHISHSFSTKNGQNSTWKSLHVSDIIVHTEISHKYIHIMEWKDQTSKEIATCEKLDSLTSCCGQAAAGMVRAFPVHFVPLQSNSTHCNVHGSHAAAENCMKCGISYETEHLHINIQNILQNTFKLEPEMCENVYRKTCKRVRQNVYTRG